MSSAALIQRYFTTAKRAAADTNCTAVVSAEHPAEVVSFQRQQPGFSPTQNVVSVASRELATCHFGGNYANCAVNANPVQFYPN